MDIISKNVFYKTTINSYVPEKRIPNHNRLQLKKYAQDKECENNCNLIEVMCCEGGCIGGNATLNNKKSAKKLINNIADKSNDIEKI